MTICHDRLRHRFFALFNGVVAFHDWCGLHYLSAGEGEARLAMPFSPRLAGPDGALGPGMIAALADVAAGQAAVTAFGWRMQVATVSLQQAMAAAVPPGRGLTATARTMSHEGDLVLVDIRIALDDAPEVTVARSTARMIAVRQVEAPAEAAAIPPRPVFSDDPLTGPEGMEEVEAPENGFRARLAFRPHFMGNTSRGALHGGLLAAALYSAARRFGDGLHRPFRVIDGMVDYHTSGRPLDLTVTLQPLRTGNRIVFLTGTVEQDLPGVGTTPIARLNATLAG